MSNIEMADRDVKQPRSADETVPSDSSMGVSIDPKAEAKIMRKFDMYAVSLLGLFYFMAILDRNNLGNANIAGLSEELGLVGNQFGTAVTLLFATYVPFEAPAVLIVKKVGPKLLLSVCAFSWGVSCLGMAFVQNYKGLYACRLLIGAFEAGLIPCINVYIGLVYKKQERGKRTSLFYAFSALASAFGGILAFGLTQINGPNGFSGWRWLFAIEGAITILLVPVFYILFPKTPTDAWFLTEEEKKMMVLRYQSDPHWGQDDHFSWKEVGKVFKDLKWYAFFVYQFSVDVSLFGFTTFLPAIVRGLGYSSIHANLMMAPIYFVALFFFVIIAFFSDRMRLRGPFLAGPLCCLIMGCAILITVENLKVRFFACFLCDILDSDSSPHILPQEQGFASAICSGLSIHVAKYYKRASMVGLTFTLANTSGATVGQIFSAQTAPRYIRGLTISLGLAILALLIVFALMIGMTFVNRKRAERIAGAEQEGAPLPSRPEDGDYDVHFKYSI